MVAPLIVYYESIKREPKIRGSYIADFTGSAQPNFLKKIKAKFANRNRVGAEEAGTSPAGAVVSNRENRRGIIKAFIVPSRSV